MPTTVQQCIFPLTPHRNGFAVGCATDPASVNITNCAEMTGHCCEGEQCRIWSLDCALFDLDGCRPIRTIVHRPKGVYYEVLELRLFRSHQRKVLHKSTTIWGILMPAARLQLQQLRANGLWQSERVSISSEEIRGNPRKWLWKLEHPEPKSAESTIAKSNTVRRRFWELVYRCLPCLNIFIDLWSW